MKELTLIGDIHGDLYSYQQIISEYENTVQIGDFGIGFLRETPEDMNAIADPLKHRFIRGNHDNPDACKNYNGFIVDSTIENDVMYVGGAASIDKMFRTPYVSWWPNEEMDAVQEARALSVYDMVRPRIMVTHECPDRVADEICRRWGKSKYNDGSIMRRLFDQMMDIHQPEQWYFGHWHTDFEYQYGNTFFKCININQTHTIEI